MIPYAQDTLVGITKHQFDIVLFGFSYIQELEETSEITNTQLSRLDSIISLKDKELSLERFKLAEKDSIELNLQEILLQHKKAARKKTIKHTLTNVVLGVGIIVEAIVLIQLAND